MALKILTLLGTRPEAIKLAPVIKELKRQSKNENIHSIVCVTAQHRQMLDQVLSFFEIEPDYDLNLMQKRQTLFQLTAGILVGLEQVLSEVRPDWVLVQGDTTTTMAASLSSFYHNIKIGHIEAGLRTHDKRTPFPEEINRRITSVIADLHFAPTESARQNLLDEGIPDTTVHVTGNTVVDALDWALELIEQKPPNLPDRLRKAIDGKRLILVTGHRRESFGEGFEQVCLALRDLALYHPDIIIVYPVHLNPNVQKPVYRILGNTRGIHLVDPLPYASFVWLMKQSYIILTDSGGIQEEGPSLGKPVLVMRNTSERLEAIEGGTAKLVGTERATIIKEVERLLNDKREYARMATVANPFGDGKAAERIVRELSNYF